MVYPIKVLSFIFACWVGVKVYRCFSRDKYEGKLDIAALTIGILIGFAVFSFVLILASYPMAAAFNRDYRSRIDD